MCLTNKCRGTFYARKRGIVNLTKRPTHALYKTYNSYQGILDSFEATIFQTSLDLCIALSNSFITKKIWLAPWSLTYNFNVNFKINTTVIFLFFFFFFLWRRFTRVKTLCNLLLFSYYNIINKFHVFYWFCVRPVFLIMAQCYCSHCAMRTNVCFCCIEHIASASP